MLKLFAIGNLTADPRIGEVNGKQVANARVAAHTPFKDANNNYITNFIDLAVWGPQRDTLARMKKGNKIAISGSFCVKLFNKNDGTTGMTISASSDTIESLTPAPANATPTNYTQPNDAELFQ